MPRKRDEGKEILVIIKVYFYRLKIAFSDIHGCNTLCGKYAGDIFLGALKSIDGKPRRVQRGKRWVFPNDIISQWLSKSGI